MPPTPSRPAPFIRRKNLASESMMSPEAGTQAPRPNPVGSVILLATLAVTGLLVTSGVDAPARLSAILVGVGLAGSLLADWKWGGIRNLIRADVFGLLALYFLLFFEFLFPQEYLGFVLHPESVRQATVLCLWGFGGLVVGRHLGHIRSSPFTELFTRPFPPGYLLAIFWISAGVGYLHMLVAVQFQVFEMVEHMMGARFSQPWSRGRLGDWRALLIELGLFMYLIPPLAGIILARREKFTKARLVPVVIMLLFTLFQGFASGTRNILASYLLTFLIGFAFASPPGKRRELYSLGGVTAAVLLVSTVLMLEFRQVGLLNYLRGARESTELTDLNLAVDYNLYSMSRLVEIFPKHHPFLGWEVPYIALIRPIPRAIWPGKPEGLSMSIEDAVGAEGWTVSTTFIGEAYMAGGVGGVLLAALALGAIMGWWSHLGSPRNSEFGMLVYASGFFAVAITMRSLFTFTTAILPTIGGLLIGALLLSKVRSLRATRRAGDRPSEGRADKPRGPSHPFLRK